MRALFGLTLLAGALGGLAGCSNPGGIARHGDVTVVTLYSYEGVWFDAGGRITQDRTYLKARDGFGVMLHLTTARNLIDTFARTPFLARLEMPESAHAGEKFYALLIFFGPGKDLNGRSFVTFTGRVRDPYDRPYQDFVDAPVFKEPNLAPDSQLRMSNARITLQFTRESLPGNYTVELVVTDHIKHVSLSLSQVIPLEETSSSTHLLAETAPAPPEPLPGDCAQGWVD